MRTFDGFMKGVNLGGWISQYDEFIKKDVAKTELYLNVTVDGVQGEEQPITENKAALEHFETFITEADFENIAKMGMDHVRIPVDYCLFEDEKGKRIELGYDIIHKAIGWAKKYGLHVLVDMHEIFGYSFDPLKVNLDREKFFYDEKLQARYQNLWNEVSKEFGNDPDNIAFELLNEVVLMDVHEAWNKVVAGVIPVIRKNAPKSWIVVGGVCYSGVHTVPLLDPPTDDRIVYNFHCYEPMVFTHQRAYWVGNMPKDWVIHYPASLGEYREKSKLLSQDLAGGIYSEDIQEMTPEYFMEVFKKAADYAAEQNVPLYCGEYGVIDKAPAEDTYRWHKDVFTAFQKYGIGRALWNYKEKDFGLMDAHLDSVRDKLVEVL